MAERNNNTNIFREKSIQRVQSPDDLDRYIKTTTPPMWLLLGSIIIILVGIIVWANIGKIESSSVGGCVVKNGKLVTYIVEADKERIVDDTYVEVDGNKYSIVSVENLALAGEDTNEFLATSANIADGDWYWTVTCNANIADGNYKCKVIYERISPITFIIN